MDCGEARWVVLMRANVGSGLLCRGNHHRAGTEADQRGRGGMKSGEMVRGELVCGKACCVLAFNHTRAGTVPDRRGRCGMNQGLFRRGWIRLVVVCHVRSGLAMLCNHARAGTGLDQRQRRGMACQGWFGLVQARLVTVWKTTTRLARFRLRRRMVGCIAASLASVRLIVFGRCMARCGLVNHRRGRHGSGFEAARWS